MEEIYIFGHKNPDTDTILSALILEAIEKTMGIYKTKAYRLGEVNKETQYALDYFGVKAPELLEEVEEGKRAKGFKNISINEEFFNGHFPDYPVMPGVLILEALAQMGAICILSKEEFKGKIGFLVGADKVRWKQQVMPGDRLDLEIEITKLRGSIGVGTGYASVDGKVVCQGEIMFAIG